MSEANLISIAHFFKLPTSRSTFRLRSSSPLRPPTKTGEETPTTWGQRTRLCCPGRGPQVRTVLQGWARVRPELAKNVFPFPLKHRWLLICVQIVAENELKYDYHRVLSISNPPSIPTPFRFPALRPPQGLRPPHLRPPRPHPPLLAHRLAAVHGRAGMGREAGEQELARPVFIVQ